MTKGGRSCTGGTILDALKNVPGVTVDQDGKVSLRGSDQVAILIDGRQSSLTGFGNQRGLDGVSAANIAAIEIINNPSARFDAAGMAGIINIIYKKEQQLGWSGDLGMGVGMGQFTRQRADLPTELGSFANNEKLIPSVNLNYQTENVRSFVQGEVLFQDRLPNNEFTTRFYDDGRVIESQVPENREQYHYTVRLGVDWTLSPSNTMSVSGVHDFESHRDVAQVPFILQSSGQRARFWFWREEEDTGFTNATFNLKHQFGAAGHELGVNLQYTRGLEDEAYFLNEESPVRIGTDMTHLVAAEHTLPLSIDYTKPLKTGRLELGTKLQRRWIPVTYTVDRGVQSVIYEGLGDFSDWDENIFAAYANLVRITPRYILEGGIRAEETQVSYTIPPDNIYYPGSDAYDYFELFPNVKFTYNMTPANRVTVAYNRRVDRPGEPELRIFPKYDDPELLKVGNPFLRPQFTNAYEAAYLRSWTGGSMSTASLSARHPRRVLPRPRHRRLESKLRRRQQNLRERRQLQSDRRAGAGVPRHRPTVARVGQRQLVPERHRSLLDDVVLPDEPPVRIGGLERRHLGGHYQQSIHASPGDRVAGQLRVLRGEEHPAGTGTAALVGRLRREVAHPEPTGRVAVHVHRPLQRLRHPAGDHGPGLHGALSELHGNAGRHGGAQVSVLNVAARLAYWTGQTRRPALVGQ